MATKTKKPIKKVKPAGPKQQVVRQLQWKPIKTAPRDGTWFIAVCAGDYIPAIVRWHNDGWQQDEDDDSEGPDLWDLAFWLPLSVLPPSPVATIGKRI